MGTGHLTIDLNAIGENWRALDRMSGHGVVTGAVVKADGYGLGAGPVARRLGLSRADPQGLLILREYPASAVSAGVRGPRQTRVVFTVDLTRADGLFSARNFQIHPDDLVIATESPVNDALAISGIIGNVFGVFNRTGL